MNSGQNELIPSGDPHFTDDAESDIGGSAVGQPENSEIRCNVPSHLSNGAHSIEMGDGADSQVQHERAVSPVERVNDHEAPQGNNHAMITRSKAEYHAESDIGGSAVGQPDNSEIRCSVPSHLSNGAHSIEMGDGADSQVQHESADSPVETNIML
ncbi:hypothetical protein V6N11_050977 [Hibiscus sabdariffa]|uniref:Uncharacterized protein n=1 Tax=Hibiscus sabdariffa TaxID=183260 RepID=A0ABR2R2M8_9ROSI